MEKREWNEAFAPVKPDADLRYKVLKLTREEKAARPARGLVIRLAAVAAVVAVLLTAALWPRQTDSGIVTAPGVLKVYASDDSSWDSADVVTNLFVDAMQYEPALFCMTSNALGLGLPVSLAVPEGYWGDAKVTFDVRTNAGEFVVYDAKGNLECENNHITTENNARFFWRIFSTDAEEVIEENNGIFVDIIIRADGVAVGYAILEIGGSGPYFFPVRAETVCLPMVDEKLQEVAEGYFELGIAKLKEQCTVEYTLEEKKAEYKAYMKSIFGNADTN